MRTELNPRSVLLSLAILSMAAAACKTSPAKAPTVTPQASSGATVAAPTTAASSVAVTPRIAAGSTASIAPATTVVAAIGTPGQVTISASGVAPETITVQSGRTITWKNADSTVHQAVSNEAGIFDTGPIPVGGTATVTITAQGVHDWHDPAHPAVNGTVRVLP